MILFNINHMFAHSKVTSRIAHTKASPLMVKAMDYEIVVREFELQSRYYVHFRTNTLGKGMYPILLPAMGQIVPHLFFSENGFGIK